MTSSEAGKAAPWCTNRPANFLNDLAVADRAGIEPFLETTSVARGCTLFGVTDYGEHVYFPQGPLISLVGGNQVEVALIGSEGIVGWPALVGCKSSPYQAIVRGCDGVVLKMQTERLMTIMAVTPRLGLVLQRFVNVINVQMAETIGAYALHRIDMRLARWLLLRHDRLGGDEIVVQHNEIADNLGVRRASITDCLHIVEGNGLIRCKRGRISVRDRSGLERLAAGCYGGAETFYREVIGDFGKRAPTSQ